MKQESMAQFDHQVQDNGQCSCGFKHPLSDKGVPQLTEAISAKGYGFYLVEYRGSNGEMEVAGETMF